MIATKNLLLAGLLLFSALTQPAAAQEGEEAQLISVLQSNAPANRKEDACRRLKQIGSTTAVSALAALLTDERLNQAACDALQTMPFPAAGEALHSALNTAAGKGRLEIIHALGERRHFPAVADLTALLKDSDLSLATAAARALGEIGGPEIVETLTKAMKAPSTHDAVVDALLACANRMDLTGDRAGAAKIFRKLNSMEEKESVRAAAYAGLIRIAGKDALEMVVAGIQGKDSARQLAALQLAREVRDPKATAAFTNLLRNASPPLKAALAGLLQQRGDVAAAPAMSSLTQEKDPNARAAAISALGVLGDAGAVPLLARAAASTDEPEQKAARQALLALRRGSIAQALLDQLTSTPAEVQAEVADALSARAEKSAVPRLLELTQSQAEPTRRAAFRALGRLADASHFPQLVKLLTETDNSTFQTSVRDVFEAIAQRAEPKSTLDVSPIVERLKTTRPETRIALLQVSALFSDERLRAAFRDSLKDPDTRIRTAAERIICGTRDAGLMPDLLELARHAEESNLRSLALENYVRLTVSEDSAFPPAKRAELLKPAVPLATSPNDKKTMLSALAGVAHPDALELVERAGSNEVQAEAEVASLQISKAVLSSAPDVAEKSLERLAASAQSGNVRTNAAIALKEFKKQPAKP